MDGISVNSLSVLSSEGFRASGAGQFINESVDYQFFQPFKPAQSLTELLVETQGSLGSELKEKNTVLRESSYCKLLGSQMMGTAILSRQLISKGMLFEASA